MPGLLNYTTTIPAAKTIAEMQAMLVRAGATSVAVHYTDQHADGLTFRAPTKYGEQLFTLAVDKAAVNKVLAKQTARGTLADRMQKTAPQAERTAWRVARSWLEAQLALIEIGMASLDQVMLPYMHVAPEVTMYAAYQERQDVLQLEKGQS